ncbi:hypothetical protein [Xiamenia xianingshaonis]|nr:hypothetical protein [Xiamenia xianingshaonis]
MARLLATSASSPLGSVTNMMQETTHLEGAGELARSSPETDAA